jgi:cell division protein FtsB
MIRDLPKIHFLARTWVLVFLTLAVFLGMFSLSRAIIHYGQRRQIIQDARERLNVARDERDRLTRELAQAKSITFVEKEAREKLNLGKPGEVTVVLPPFDTTIQQTEIGVDTSPNLLKWFRVFR